MRNTLAFLAAVVLVVAGLGWYLDWYKVDTTPAEDGHREVNIDVNARKVTADVKKGAEAGAEEVQQVLEKQPSTPAESGKTITINPRIVIEGQTPHAQ